MISNSTLALLGVKSVVKIEDDLYEMELDIESQGVLETIPFVYRPSDPYGIAPQVKQWFVDFGGLPE